MNEHYENVKRQLQQQPVKWLVTGVAGFIGSNILENLLHLGQEVVGLDNFVTGFQHNLDDVQKCVGAKAWDGFHFIQGDIRSLNDCREACDGVTYVLHQAALGSVPRSIDDPLATHAANVTGFANLLVAANDAKVSRLVYASSSSVYGDHPELPKCEAKLGEVLSPYAASKLVDEIYAQVFKRVYGVESVGLRYFNVFGPRQDPEGGYAAVIPRWIGRMLRGDVCQIYGDGQTSRDFTFVDNAVQANILAATEERAVEQPAYNIACGQRMTLNELYEVIRSAFGVEVPALRIADVDRSEVRSGDVRHSLADITSAAMYLGYSPNCLPAEGMNVTTRWYVQKHYKAEAVKLKQAS